MDVSAVKQQIKNKAVRPFYVFIGPEVKVQDMYIEQMAKVSLLEVRYANSVSEIYNRLLNKSFLAQDFLYVIREDKDFMLCDKAWDNWKEVLGTNKVIMRCTEIDKRSKFYKHFEDVIVDFKPMKLDVLIKYIQKDINLSAENAKKLAEICDKDYSRILLEIDKIKHYANNYDKTEDIYDKSFKAMLFDGAIHIPPKDAIFDFVDAVLRDYPRQAFDYLSDCRAVGEATMVELSVLYNNTKQVLQVQSCHSSDIGKSTGLTPWQIKCAKDKSGYYNINELVDILRLVRQVEKGIKTGTIDEDIAIDYILVNIL